ncbi:MAG: sulfatase [Pseudomonadota bacterium]
MRSALLLTALLLAGCRAEPRPPSFVLVCLDTLRADHIGAWGDPEALTPNLDALAAESVMFTSAWSQANITHMSHGSLFASRYPSELGATTEGFSPATDSPLMAEILSTWGYQTAAAVGGGHLAAGRGLERGFDTWARPAPLGSLFHTVPVALDALDVMDPERPFLLFVHGYDAHTRYLKPAPLGLKHADPAYAGPGQRAARELLGTVYVLDGRYYEGVELPDLLDMRAPRPWGAEARAALPAAAAVKGIASTPLDAGDLSYLEAVYDGAVSYADAWLGLLLAALQERGTLDEAWLILVSDHGESLGEDGYFDHVLTLSDATLRVPLLIRPPGGLPEGRSLDGQTALLDVLPTVLEIAEIQPPTGIHGTSLLPAIEGAPWPGHEAVFAEGSIRMVSARSAAGRLTFAGMGADSPFLAEALAAAPLGGVAFADSPPSDPATRAALRAALLAWRAALRPSPGTAVEPSPAQREELRKHGYWSAP